MKNGTINISKKNGLARVQILDSEGDQVLVMHVANKPGKTEVYFTRPGQIEVVDLENEIIETPEEQNA